MNDLNDIESENEISNHSNDFITIKDTSKYFVKSSDFLTDSDEKIKKLSVI